MPRPTRLRLRLAPRAGFSRLIAIAIACSASLQDFHQIRDPAHHPPTRRRVDPRHDLVEALESETLHDQLVLARAADRAPDVLDPEPGRTAFLFRRHPYSSSTCLPRILATSPGSFRRFRPSKVALTTLCGLVLPSDLVRMLEIPAD